MAASLRSFACTLVLLAASAVEANGQCRAGEESIGDMGLSMMQRGDLRSTWKGASDSQRIKSWGSWNALGGANASAAPLTVGPTCTSPQLVAFSALVAVVAELFFAALGFGPAVVYEIFWELFHVIGVSSGELEEAVWNSLIMSSVVAVVQAFWLRQHFNWKVVVLMTFPLVSGLPIGTVVLEKFGSTHWVKKLLGVFFLAMVGIQGFRKREVKPRIEDFALSTTAWTVFASFIGGVSRGLFGISAPVSVLLLFFSLDRELWRFVNAIYRIAIFSVQGSMLAVHLRPQPKCIHMYFSLIGGGILGMAIGNAIAPHIQQEDMQHWLSAFLAAAGLLMLCEGHRQLEVAVSMVITVLLLHTLAAGMCLARRVCTRPALFRAAKSRT